MSDYTSTTAAADDVLVQCHISDREREFCISVYADLVKIERAAAPDGQKEARKGGGKRGQIYSFSAQSRKRMLERLARLRDTSGGYFVTLTYAGRFCWSSSEVKNHLAVFRKALLRRFPAAGAFWRMELKPRQSGESMGDLVPHFHLLIFGVNPPSLAFLRRWIRFTWSRIVAYPDSPRRLVRTQCDQITTRRHAANYASKYAAKADVTEFEPGLEDCYNGRHWGVFGDLDLAAAITVTIGLQELIRFKRLVRSWLKSRGSRYARRLARVREDFGFAYFGLGDLSPGGGGDDVFNGTIMRMLFASSN